MAIKDPHHHHDLFDPDKSGGGGSFSEFVGGQAGISPCHRSPHQRDDRQPQAAAVLLIVWTFSKEWEEHYLSSWERSKCKVTDLNDDCGTIASKKMEWWSSFKMTVPIVRTTIAMVGDE